MTAPVDTAALRRSALINRKLIAQGARTFKAKNVWPLVEALPALLDEVERLREALGAMTDPDEAYVVLKVPRDGTDIEICRWRGAQRLSRAEAEDYACKWSLDYPAYTYIAVPVAP